MSAKSRKLEKIVKVVEKRLENVLEGHLRITNKRGGQNIIIGRKWVNANRSKFRCRYTSKGRSRERHRSRRIFRECTEEEEYSGASAKAGTYFKTGPKTKEYHRVRRQNK